MKAFSSKRRVMAVAAFILLALFMLRPGASRLKSRIILSLSAGVGRPVDVGSVHIRLLPRPGFDLENLVVYDDPAFGAEPMLRASEVTADLRLTSLLRGRLEIAHLDLADPSLNLVHGESGRWNLEALLERTAHAPTAPTAKAKSEPRPGFPYIEGSSARINFKNGQEKKPYALTNADFSLWQESENSWGVRLKAQPVRTDLNLNDTGLLQVSGTWQRAASLRDTPVQFSIEWSRAQLGQVTKLFLGSDQGWRGAILLDVALTGSPANLQVSSSASVDDFRRYDITAGRALRLAGSCDAEYSSMTHELRGVKCSSPIAKGFITLTGDVGLSDSRSYSLAVEAERVPANALVALAVHAKKNLPDDIEAEGTLQGKFSFRHNAASESKPRVEGRGEISDFRLHSTANHADIGPETVPFVLLSRAVPRANVRKKARGESRVRYPDGPHIEFGPVALEAGRTGNGATVQGWIDRSGYGVTVAGETDVANDLRDARMIGLPASPANPEGSAQVDLQVAGLWAGQNGANGTGFQRALVTGTARLRNVKVAAHGVGPVEVVAADMQLLADTVRVEKLNAKAAGSIWTGSLETPRGCGSPEMCAVHFSLNTEDASLARLKEWAHPSPKKRAWYQVLEVNAPAGQSLLARLQGSGRINADHLQIGSVDAAHASAVVVFGGRTLDIPQLSADFLGGKHHGMWHADFRSMPAMCSGSGKLASVSLARMASAMKDPWIAGTANATYQVKGPCTADFWRSGDGTLQFEMRDGILRHISLSTTQEPFQFSRLSGQADLRDGKIELGNTNLDSAEANYEISGTATLQRAMSFEMTRLPGDTKIGYAISGTLAEPLVAPLARSEQARLKTPSPK